MSNLSERPQNKNFGQNTIKSNKQKRIKNEEQYYKNPVLCQTCKNSIPYQTCVRKMKFCSQSCAAIFNNSNRPESIRIKQRVKTSESLRKTKNGLPIDYKLYQNRCRFRFLIERYIDKIPNSELIKAEEPFNPFKNRHGWTRDHMYSVYDGYINKIDSSLIKHPANCQILLCGHNSRKGKNSSISLEELYERIKHWKEF